MSVCGGRTTAVGREDSTLETLDVRIALPSTAKRLIARPSAVR